MFLDQNEEHAMRSVALQNANAVLLARERAEREAVEARERMTRILESIRDGFLALDHEWRFTYVNRSAEEILRPLQKSRQNLIGNLFLSEFPQVIDTELERALLRAAHDQMVVDLETFFTPLQEWFEVRIYPAPEGLSVYFRNVTQRRRTAEALRASEQRLRATFEQAAVGIGIASLTGQFEQVNEHLSDILGYSPDELTRLTVQDVTPPEDRTATVEKIRELIDGKLEECLIEKRFLHKNGSHVWTLTTVTLLKDAQGQPENLVAVVEDIRERKVAENAVREGAERLQLAMSAGHLGDWSWDAATDVVTLGRGASLIFGLPLGETITWGKMRELLHPEDQERAKLAVERALAEQSDYSVDYRVRRDGVYYWVAAKGRGTYDPEGTLVGMIGVVQDISDRKDAEELRSRLAAVVESSDDAIISMGLDTVITTWNKGAERIFGYTAAEVIGKSVSLLIPPDSEDEEPVILQRLLQGDRIDHYETVRMRKDGQRLNVSLTVSPIYNALGNIVGVSKISRDITERKRAERALQEERRLLELLNSSGQAIASELDLEKVIQKVTDSATQLTGAQFGAFFYNVLGDDEESFLLYTLSGMTREAFEKYGYARATPLFNSAFKDQGPIRSDDVTKDPRYAQSEPGNGMLKGHLPLRSYLAVPVISRDAEVIGGLFFGHSDPGIFSDRSERLVVGMAAQAAVAIDNARLFDAAQKEITERKRAEAALRDAQNELKKHAEKLEEQVAERTSRLRETIQELEAFSYSISHDLRSPLRAMQGYADALIEDYSENLDQTAEDYLMRIRRAATRMDMLIQDVLAYSRVAKSEIELREVNVEHVIRDVIQNYPALQPGAADITVVSGIPHVLGHEAYLTQIVSNFLGNAVKFVEPRKKPVITVRAKAEDGMVRIIFEDNGIGIAPEHQQQIFQIFGRVYSDKKFEGTGIGLAIAKKAAERMGGSVGVDSQLGKGSQFFVLLKKA